MTKPIFLVASFDKFPGLPPHSTERLKYERFMHSFHYPFIIHPYSRFRYYWDCSVCIIVLIHMIWSTFVLTSVLHGHIAYHLPLLGFHIHGLVDVVLNFLTGYVEKSENNIVLFPSRIVLNYLKSWFFVDFISVIPFESLSYFFKSCPLGPKSNESFGCHSVVDIFSLFYVFRMFSFHRCFTRIVWLNLINFSWAQGILHIFWLLGIFLTFANFNLFIPFYNPYCSETWFGYSYNFCQENKEEGVCAIYNAKLQSFVASALSLWEENLAYLKDYETNEIILRIFFLHFSALLSLLPVIAIVINLMLASKSPKERYYEANINLRNYLAKKPLTKALRKKVLLYMQTESEKKVYEDEILEFLPEFELQKITLNMTLPLIQKVSFFANFPKELLKEIACLLRNEIYLPYDVLVQAGEIGRSMFFIKFGTVAIYSKKFVKLTELDDGEFFGAKSIVFSMKLLNSSAIALKISSVCLLDRDDFLAVMQSHPGHLDYLQRALIAEKEKRI